MSKWLPIEGAPKDGTPIDLWAGGRVPDARWGRYYRTTKEEPDIAMYYDGWVVWNERFDEWYEVDHENPERITHYMPIPGGPDDLS